jgi:hypothetical protein
LIFLCLLSFYQEKESKMNLGEQKMNRYNLEKQKNRPKGARRSQMNIYNLDGKRTDRRKLAAGK